MVQQFVTAYEVKIFNRLGEAIFRSNDPERSWTGLDDRGRTALEGVYIYHVSGIDAEGNEVEGSGTVTLLR